MRKVTLFLLFIAIGCSSSDDNVSPPIIHTPPVTYNYNPPIELYGTWGMGEHPLLRPSFVFQQGSFAEYDAENILVDWDDKAQDYRDEGHTVTTDEVKTSTSYEVIMWVDAQKLSRKFQKDATNHWKQDGVYPMFKMSN